jgi:hypothetical protein
LIHKQASLKERNPEQPFYLLDDGTQPIPPLSYPMLNKCLALPLLPDWAGYLWENGRERSLITLLDDGEGQGYGSSWHSVRTNQLLRQCISCYLLWLKNLKGFLAVYVCNTVSRTIGELPKTGMIEARRSRG